MHISVFISSHGYGHASRCSAVMEALYTLSNEISFTIYTRIPSSFFKKSLSASHQVIPLKNDVGLVQKSPMVSDLEETLSELKKFYPISGELLADLDTRFQNNRTRAVICDISPLGIQAGLYSGLPVFLVENFTWDWIYQDYASKYPEFGYYAEWLKKLFEHPEVNRIQAQPAAPTANPALSVSPISRSPRLSPAHVKQYLRIPTDSKMVLITMGGIPHNYQLIDPLEKQEQLTFLLPGTSGHLKYENNCILFPHESDFFHPDLVGASDLVVGKLGYSTLAEVYATSTPFLYIKREGFKEMEILESFARNYLNASPIHKRMFEGTQWISQIHELLERSSPIKAPSQDGAGKAAHYLLTHCTS